MPGALSYPDAQEATKTMTTTFVTQRGSVPSEARSQIARAAALKRFHPDRTEEISVAKNRAVLITLEDHIKRVVAAVPVTDEQRDRLVALIHGCVA